MRAFLTILTLTFSLNSFGTEWLTYYVYYETEYVQGTWTRTNILEQSNYKYLTVEAYEDLFGSGDDQFVEKLLTRLKTKKPELYKWNYDLFFKGDTVLISTNAKPENMETIRNEITATITFNNFKAVTFNFGNNSETLNKNDLTLPYFDLVSNESKYPKIETEEIKEQSRPNQTDEQIVKGNPLTTWLIISIIFNFGLIGLFIMKRLNN